MAEPTKDNAVPEEPKPKSRIKKMLIWGIVALVGIGGGFATPVLLMSSSNDSGTNDVAKKVEDNQLPIPEPGEDVGFVPFGEDVVVNFNDPRFSRYLKLQFSMQVAESQSEEIKVLLEEKHDVLINWLIGHIADMRVEDIRGTQGTNRLRREIHDSFNNLLFTDGIERIQDVLFQELNIQ